MSRIDIPSFDAFLADMGEDRVVQWADEANAAIESLSPVRPPVTQEGMNEFVTAMAAYSHRLSIAMLRDYHEWLIAKLSERSVHLLGN